MAWLRKHETLLTLSIAFGALFWGNAEVQKALLAMVIYLAVGLDRKVADAHKRINKLTGVGSDEDAA